MVGKAVCELLDAVKDENKGQYSRHSLNRGNITTEGNADGTNVIVLRGQQGMYSLACVVLPEL